MKQLTSPKIKIFPVIFTILLTLGYFLPSGSITVEAREFNRGSTRSSRQGSRQGNRGDRQVDRQGNRDSRQNNRFDNRDERQYNRDDRSSRCSF